MIIRNGKDVRPSEITPREIYVNRRELLGAGLGAGAALSLAGLPFGEAQAAALTASKSPFSTTETPTAREYVTSYNNYYEFGTNKGIRARTRARSPRRPGT